MSDDHYRTAELVELLVAPRMVDGPRWARALLLRTLETQGWCRYRRDRLSGRGPALTAALSLRMAYRLLEGADRRLFTRMMLVVPWERVRRDTGLGLRIAEVLQLLSAEAGLAECVEAAHEVVSAGPRVVSGFPLADLLVEERATGGMTFRLPAEARAHLGVTSATVRIDRVQGAVQSFRGRGWEANLRAIVPWWLDALADSELESAVALALHCAAPTKKDPSAAQYCLLGLADWMSSNPHHPAAGTTLDLCLAASGGAVRKAGTHLASKAGRAEILERLAESDPDRSVRRTAAELLAGR